MTNHSDKRANRRNAIAPEKAESLPTDMAHGGELTKAT